MAGDKQPARPGVRFRPVDLQHGAPHVADQFRQRDPGAQAVAGRNKGDAGGDVERSQEVPDGAILRSPVSAMDEDKDRRTGCRGGKDVVALPFVRSVGDVEAAAHRPARVRAETVPAFQHLRRVGNLAPVVVLAIKRLAVETPHHGISRHGPFLSRRTGCHGQETAPGYEIPQALDRPRALVLMASMSAPATTLSESLRSAALPSPAQVGVERAISELRRGGLVALRDTQHHAAIVVQAAEMATAGSMRLLQRLTGSEPTVAVTRHRVVAIRPNASEASVQSLIIPTGAGPDVVHRIVDPTFPADSHEPTAQSMQGLSLIPERDGGLAHVAVQLVKLARLLPAVLFARPAARDVDRAAQWSRDSDLVLVESGHVRIFPRLRAGRLVQAVSARVPLADAEDTTLIAFRPLDGGEEHVAIMVGDPDLDGPVLVRLHSQCLTGDLLGSLRCDCGDQLRGAIRAIADEGSGVLVYLAQEGRGIGLMNKLRAYRLQDLGLDTVDANELLGFDADERIYLPAAEILRQLGIGTVRLMTNNPDKVDQLEASGVRVVERVSHVFPSNKHNETYLLTKANRSGHLF